MIRKVLIYPVLVFLVLLLAATLYILSGDKNIRHSNIRIENAVVRAPMPGQTVGVLYFHIVNAGGANELLSISTPVSSHVELHTVLQENDIMKMRRVETVKIQALTTTKFERGGLHVMLFGAKIPKGKTANDKTGKDMRLVPLTFTFARPPTPDAAQAEEKTYTLTLEATLYP